MNIQTVAEQHSETLEDIAKFFIGLTYHRYGPGNRIPKPITLAQPIKTETIQ